MARTSLPVTLNETQGRGSLQESRRFVPRAFSLLPWCSDIA